MDPTVTAAAIGVGGTVIVGVAGFSAAIWTTRQTIAHARESRIWDKRAAAYEAALTELANRQVRRLRAMRSGGDVSKVPELLAEFHAAQDTPAWPEVEGRLLAYCSQRVWDVLEAVRAADRAASESFDQLMEQVKAARQTSGDDRPPVTREKYVDAAPLGKSTAALVDCAKHDSMLVDLIRAELQGQAPGVGTIRQR